MTVIELERMVPMSKRERQRRKRRRSRAAIVDHVLMDRSGVRGPGFNVSRLFAEVSAVRRQVPGAPVTVVLPAAVRHTLSLEDQARVDRAMFSGLVVVPPAGCVGGASGFVELVCDAIVKQGKAVVLA